MYVLPLLFSCIPTKETVVTVIPTPVLHERKIDYSALFEGRNSSSLYDQNTIVDDLMSRVLLEEHIIQVDLSDVPIENWTREILFSGLTKQGSILSTAIPQNDTRKPCVAGGCLEEHPTVTLRNLSFVSSTEDIEVVVRENAEGVFQVLIRDDISDESVCPAEFSLPVGFVEFATAVQRLSDGAIVAMIHEIKLLPKQSESLEIVATIEDSGQALCDAISNIYLEEPSLSRSSGRYYEAAVNVVKVGLGPLY